MDTLLIVQNDRKLRDLAASIRDSGWTDAPPGKRSSYRLKVVFTPPDDPRQGVATGGMLSGSPNQIVNQIVAFADLLATNRDEDAIRFQVVFVFHQTSTDTVRRMTTAIDRLDRHGPWRNLPFQHVKHFIVSRVWFYPAKAQQIRLPTLEAFHAVCSGLYPRLFL